MDGGFMMRVMASLIEERSGSGGRSRRDVLLYAGCRGVTRATPSAHLLIAQSIKISLSLNRWPGLQYQRELPLILGHKLIARRKKLEDRDHHLPGLLADSLAIALHQIQAEGEVVGMGGQKGACGVDAACPLSLSLEHQCGLEPLGLGFEEAAPLQGGKPGRRVLNLSLRKGNPHQADLSLGQV